MVHLKRISFKDVGLRYAIGSCDKPVAYVKPKENLLLEIEDACSGQIKKRGDHRNWKTIPYGNPVVGPIYIEGAEKGSTISISIKEIRPTTGKGVTYFPDDGYVTGPSALRFMKVNLPNEPKIFEIRNGLVYFDRIGIPYQPMIGTIGVAPYREKESVSTSVAGRHGGNMDLPEIAPGSKIFLPVNHSGALLYLGDAHAVQGDGEISGNAVEMPAEVKIEVDIINEESIKWPRVETEMEIASVGTAGAYSSLQDAIRTAFMELAIWMEEKHGFNRFEALMLCSQVGRLRLGNLWTVAAKIEKKYLNSNAHRNE